MGNLKKNAYNKYVNAVNSLNNFGFKIPVYSQSQLENGFNRAVQIANAYGGNFSNSQELENKANQLLNRFGVNTASSNATSRSSSKSNPIPQTFYTPIKPDAVQNVLENTQLSMPNDLSVLIPKSSQMS